MLSYSPERTANVPCAGISGIYYSLLLFISDSISAYVEYDDNCFSLRFGEEGISARRIRITYGTEDRPFSPYAVCNRVQEATLIFGLNAHINDLKKKSAQYLLRQC